MTSQTCMEWPPFGVAGQLHRTAQEDSGTLPAEPRSGRAHANLLQPQKRQLTLLQAGDGMRTKQEHWHAYEPAREPPLWRKQLSLQGLAGAGRKAAAARGGPCS